MSRVCWCDKGGADLLIILSLRVVCLHQPVARQDNAGNTLLVFLVPAGFQPRERDQDLGLFLYVNGRFTV